MMKFFVYFSLLLTFSGCKEKSFADEINLQYPKHEKLSFQQFNEGLGETGTGVIYIGKEASSIEVKYFRHMLSPPPPPPSLERIQQDSARERIIQKYFYPSVNRVYLADKPVIFDSLTSKSVEIIVKVKDTIPKYMYNFETETLKKYKSFPVFIKNISGRKLILPEFKSLFPALLNNQQKWQIIRNDNALICGNRSWNYAYWEFEPDEIMVVSVNFLPGTSKGKFKLYFGNAASKPFLMNYDKKIIEYQ
jgi:hypothetical protein